MKEKTKVKLKKIYIIIYILLTVLIILSTIYIVNFFLLKKEAVEQSSLLKIMENNENQETTKLAQNILEKNETIIEEDKQTEAIEVSEQANKETERMLQIKQLKEENFDIIGWIEIENTTVNYPVLQGTDNQFYMTHNYKKEKSKNGSIFLDSNYNWNIPSNNLLIYGHNLGNDTMFQDLLKYESENYYQQHPKIRFTTVDDDSEYEIISVLKSRVYYKSETNVFRYYFFINNKSEEEYNQFVKNAKKESLYPIDATASYGEQLITLSTCSYHVKDGRFAIIGKRQKGT